MTSLAFAAPAATFKKITVREAAVLLALAWLLPFLIHLVPWSGMRPLGAYLLPIFWVVFVAVYFHGATAGLLTGLFAPVINLVVTGQPAWASLGMLTLELVVFVFATVWAVRHLPWIWLMAPLGYFVARTVTMLVLSPVATLGHTDAAGYFFTHLVMGGGPGLVVLAFINAALVKFYPKSAEPDA